MLITIFGKNLEKTKLSYMMTKFNHSIMYFKIVECALYVGLLFLLELYPANH